MSVQIWKTERQLKSTFGQNEIVAVVSDFKFDSLPSSSTEGKDQ